MSLFLQNNQLTKHSGLKFRIFMAVHWSRKTKDGDFVSWWCPFLHIAFIGAIFNWKTNMNFRMSTLLTWYCCMWAFSYSGN
jgi:hypothetical protein